VTPGSTAFKGWKDEGEYLCEPTNSTTCTIAVEDQPTWAGARFGDDPQGEPQLPTTITVEFKLRKGGSGSGRITATKLDCGTVCSANYGFGKPITLTANPDDGSLFDGWNGVCAKTQTTCTLAAGPITSIRAAFARVTTAPVARDTAAPSAPGVPSIRRKTRTSIAIEWTPSSDNVGVTAYRVYVNDAAAGERREADYTLEGLKCGRSYAIAVEAIDASGNRSQRAGSTVRTQPCALAARLASVGIQRVGANRMVVVKLRVNRVTSGRLRLVRRGRAVATGRYRVRPGMNTLRLRVRRTFPSGPYRLTIALVNPDGGTLALRARGVRLPRP
jgi:fibronectin type III domain protein/List-Bact-rpt repeat protein